MFEPDASRVFVPGISAEYLRKRFDEAIWESPIAAHLDPDDWSGAVDTLVERLLIEIGVS